MKAPSTDTVCIAATTLVLAFPAYLVMAMLTGEDGPKPVALSVCAVTLITEYLRFEFQLRDDRRKRRGPK